MAKSASLFLLIALTIVIASCANPMGPGAGDAADLTTSQPGQSVVEEPVVEEPVIEEPVIDEPVIDEPAANDSYTVNDDGSISFTERGLTVSGVNQDRFSVHEDGSLSIGGSGERRAYADTMAISKYRIEIEAAQIVEARGSSARGWGVILHGGLNEADAFEGYTVQIDPGAGNGFLIRRWVDGREGSRGEFAAAGDFGIDLMKPMDIAIDVDGTRISMVVNDNTIFDNVELQQPGRADGFVGIRSWANTQVELGGFRVTIK